jgi:hypothetical protein
MLRRLMTVNFRPDFDVAGVAAGGRAAALAEAGWTGATRGGLAGDAGCAGTRFAASVEASAAPQAMQNRPAGCATGAPHLGQVVGVAMTYLLRLDMNALIEGPAQGSQSGDQAL